MTTERQTLDILTKLRNAETTRDEYADALDELAADLRVAKEQLRIAEGLLDERPDLAARYQAAINVAA